MKGLCVMSRLGLILLCGLAVGSSLQLWGQEATPVKEPEYRGVPFFLNPSTADLVPLERQVPQVKTQTKLLGMGGAKALVSVPGAKSPVRLQEGNKRQFVLKVAS